MSSTTHKGARGVPITHSKTREYATYLDSPIRLSRVFDQPNAEVITACADLAFTARADQISTAILIRAEKRSAAMDALFLARL